MTDPLIGFPSRIGLDLHHGKVGREQSPLFE